MNCIQKYFPEFYNSKKEVLAELKELYIYWNERINVISRKDINELCERHVLHSLAIAKVFPFEKDYRIIDIGTGGGFPGIPLAIFFPDVTFTLIDSKKKKILVAKEVAKSLKLENIRILQVHSTEHKDKYDTIVSRAVTAFPNFLTETQHLLSKNKHEKAFSGIIYLKGGDFTDEIETYKNKCQILPLNDIFEESFFETKSILHYS